MCSNLSLPHLLLLLMAGSFEGMFYTMRNVSILLFYTKTFILAVDLILPYVINFLATSEFYSNMDKRLLGVFLIFGKWPLKFWGVIWPKDSLVCWGDLAKRLLGARAESAPRSLLARPPQHHGVFWPNHV